MHISANMSPLGLKFSQMILHADTSKLTYNWSFLFVVLHKPTFLLSTFNIKKNAACRSVHHSQGLRAPPVEKPCPSCMTASKGNLQLSPAVLKPLEESGGSALGSSWSLQNSKAWSELFDIISCHKLITAK